MYQEFTSDSQLKAEMKVLLFVNTIRAKANNLKCRITTQITFEKKIEGLEKSEHIWFFFHYKTNQQCCQKAEILHSCTSKENKEKTDMMCLKVITEVTRTFFKKFNKKPV